MHRFAQKWTTNHEPIFFILAKCGNSGFAQMATYRVSPYYERLLRMSLFRGQKYDTKKDISINLGFVQQSRHSKERVTSRWKSGSTWVEWQTTNNVDNNHPLEKNRLILFGQLSVFQKINGMFVSWINFEANMMRLFLKWIPPRSFDLRTIPSPPYKYPVDNPILVVLVTSSFPYFEKYG